MYVCYFLRKVKQQEKPDHNEPRLSWFPYLWVVLIAVLLTGILKPYNKAYVNLLKPGYSFSDVTHDSTSYVVDYNGVIDLVSNEGKARTKVLIRESGKLMFKVKVKSDEQNGTFWLWRNDKLVDSVTLSNGNDLKAKVRCRRNDYLKFELLQSNGKPCEASVKMEKSNADQQRSIYAIVLIWLLLGWMLIRKRLVSLSILPSIGLLLAVYSEHLYTYPDWFEIMSGFVLLTIAVVAVKSWIANISSGLIRRVGLVLIDYALVGFILFCSLFVMNYKRFGFRLDFDSIVAILQSNSTEMKEFALNEIPWFGWILILVLFASPVILNWRLSPTRPLRFSLTLLFLLLGIGLSSGSRFIHEFSQAYGRYYEEIDKFNEVQQKFNTPENLQASKEAKGETYLVVVGESQSKEHMSLYGYHRRTTPFLDSQRDANKITVINNAYSCHTHTVLVLRNALTQANQYNGLNYTEVPTIINVLNAANFKTVWLSNQVKLSNWDNLVSAIASGCDEQIYVNKNIGETIDNAPYDEEILPQLERLLNEETDQNRVIFVHLMGNHGTYGMRYPSDFKTLPSRGVADYGRGKHIPTWEAYDNSMLYNDWIMSQIHEMLDTKDSSVKALCYFADHGEDLEEGRGHNAGNFTYRMAQIPMYYWFSDGYRKRYNESVKYIELNKQKQYTNDLIFQSLLHMTQTSSDYGDMQYNHFDSSYILKQPLIMEGQKVYDHPDNPYFKGRWHASRLKIKGDVIRTGIHRVNSYGKYYEVRKSLFTTIEIDVKIEEEGLMVGHGEEGSMSGETLYTYLRNVKHFGRVWLDVKNLNNDNIDLLIRHLDKLREAEFIDDRDIIETSFLNLNVRRIIDAGYNLSYYLPTSILDMTPAQRMKEKAWIVKKVSGLRLKHISFDSRLYDWVKSDLETSLSGSVAYHTWDLSLNVRHGSFLDAYESRPFVSDDRVKTILIVYPSVFDL